MRTGVCEVRSGRGIIRGRGLAALLLALCLLPLCAWAASPPVETAQSNVRVKGYPTPWVPLRERVADSYFDDVLMLGDSLASGIPYYKVMPALNVVFRIGLAPGSIARDAKVMRQGRAYQTVPEHLRDLHPKVLYIWLGLNGVEGNPADEILGYYDTMLNRIIAALPDTLICLVELTPVTPEAVQNRGRLSNRNVNDFNAGLWRLAREHNVYLLRWHDTLLGDDGAINKKYASTDGYHLSKGAYRLLVDYLYTHTLPLDALENAPRAGAPGKITALASQ
ncbi:MAG: GDSL-type esterase/lipase family protein [Oscillospiraceae bacterium]|jgi:hypothetical protein|nr:GDSL-type esterase/lipase family protein [Oscillospiraceae bacterium]